MFEAQRAIHEAWEAFRLKKYGPSHDKFELIETPIL